MNTAEQRFEDAFNVLKVMGVPVYHHPDESVGFSISAEEPTSDEWVSLYRSGGEWDFGVNPALMDVLAKFHLFAEWVNPGRLHVYDNK